MKKITKKDIDWVCNASFGRHKSPDIAIKKFTLRQIASVILICWEAGKKGVLSINKG